MTDSESNRQSEIEALLSERKKFEAWLAQLEVKRASAASHVFERVHADYAKRLDEVRSKLAEQADTIRELVGDLEKRLGSEQEKITKKTDERAEAELRAMVGEFAEDEWNSTRGKLDKAIETLRAKFDGTERELGELRDLLASVQGAPAPARPSVMQRASIAVDDDLKEAAAAEPAPPEEPPPPPKLEPPVAPSPRAAKPTPAPAPAPAPEPPVPPRKSTPFDELAFLKSVAGTPSGPSGTAAVKQPEPPAPPPPAAPAPAPPAPRASAPRPRVSEPVTAPKPFPEPVAAEPPAPPPVAEEAPIEAFEPGALAPEPARPRTSSTANVEPGPLGGPTPRTSQAIRSLKCQECGTLNFPTEWYCERCGGELAAF